MQNHEFNTFPAIVDPKVLQPSLCIQGCSALGSTLAAIENGSMCFCKISQTISSVQSNDTDCQSIICEGNRQFYCGSTSYLMVYQVVPYSKVK